MNVRFDLDDAALDTLAAMVAERLAATAPAEPEPWISVDDAAAYLACSKRRVYDLVQQRRIPFAKDGSRLLFRRSEIDAALDCSHPVCTPAESRIGNGRSGAPAVAKAGGQS